MSSPQVGHNRKKKGKIKMNSFTKSLLVLGVISVSMYAEGKKDLKACIDNNGKKDAIRFVDLKEKKHNYVLLEVSNSKELLEKRNNAGILPNGEILVKTSDSTVTSLGKVTNKCVSKTKAFASL